MIVLQMERGTDDKADMFLFYFCTWMTQRDVKEQPHQRPTPTPLDTLAGQCQQRGTRAAALSSPHYHARRPSKYSVWDGQAAHNIIPCNFNSIGSLSCLITVVAEGRQSD